MFDPRLGPIVAEHITSELELDLRELWVNNYMFCRWLGSLDIQIYSARIFRSLPNIEYQLHVDVDPKIDNTYAAKILDADRHVYEGVIKLNFIQSSSGNTMTWYGLKSGCEPHPQVNTSGYTSWNFNKEDCDVVYHTMCDQDCLVNGGQIHTLTNGDNLGSPRMCYSLSIHNNARTLTWDQAVELFTPWLQI